MDPNSYKLGQYQIRDHIGVGGFGTVYRATHEQDGRDVAIKFIFKRDLDLDEQLDEVRQELEVSKGLKHPNVLDIESVGDTTSTTTSQIPPALRQTFYCGETKSFPHSIDDCHSLPLSTGKERIVYLISEYCERGSLDNVYGQQRPFSPRDAVALFRRICECTKVLHENHYVHRDIKPQNVLYGNDGEFKICDFGLTRLLLPDASSLRSVAGTEGWSAPEQFQDGAKVDHRSDIYALGRFLEWLLKDPEPENIESGLRQVISRCKANNPGDRYQSIEELLQALDDWEGQLSLPDTVHPARKIFQPVPGIWGLRRWLGIGLVSAVALLTIIGVVLGSWLNTEQPQLETPLVPTQTINPTVDGITAVPTALPIQVSVPIPTATLTPSPTATFTPVPTAVPVPNVPEAPPDAYEPVTVPLSTSSPGNGLEATVPLGEVSNLTHLSRIRVMSGGPGVGAGVLVRRIRKENAPAGPQSVLVFRNHDITLEGVTDSDSTGGEIEFEVKRSWLQAQNINAADVSLYRLHGEWSELPTRHTGQFVGAKDQLYEGYFADTPGFSVFAVGVKIETQPVALSTPTPTRVPSIAKPTPTVVPTPTSIRVPPSSTATHTPTMTHTPSPTPTSPSKPTVTATHVPILTPMPTLVPVEVSVTRVDFVPFEPGGVIGDVGHPIVRVPMGWNVLVRATVSSTAEVQGSLVMTIVKDIRLSGDQLKTTCPEARYYVGPEPKQIIGCVFNERGH